MEQGRKIWLKIRHARMIIFQFDKIIEWRKYDNAKYRHSNSNDRDRVWSEPQACLAREIVRKLSYILILYKRIQNPIHISSRSRTNELSYLFFGVRIFLVYSTKYLFRFHSVFCALLIISSYISNFLIFIVLYYCSGIKFN